MRYISGSRPIRKAPVPIGSHAVQSVALGPLHDVHVPWHGWQAPPLSSYKPAGHAARHVPPWSSGRGSAQEVQLEGAPAAQVRHS